jgi:ribosome-associated protein
LGAYAIAPMPKKAKKKTTKVAAGGTKRGGAVKKKAASKPSGARSRPGVAGKGGVPRARKKATAPKGAPRAAAVKPAIAEDKAREYAVEAARLLADYDCREVVVMDVRKVQDVMDYIVIGSGTSATQMRSVLDHVESLGRRLGFPAFRTSRDDRSLWLLLDSVDVVVHLFEPNTRAHYELEMMWGDAPRVGWERADQVKRDLAGLGS